MPKKNCHDCAMLGGCANKERAPVAILVLCFDNRCDFNYYTACRRLTELPSGPHHSTSVLWLHARKGWFPSCEDSRWQMPRSHLTPAADARVNHRDTSLSLPASAPLYLLWVAIIDLFLCYLNNWTQMSLISKSYKLRPTPLDAFVLLLCFISFHQDCCISILPASGFSAHMTQFHHHIEGEMQILSSFRIKLRHHYGCFSPIPSV